MEANTPAASAAKVALVIRHDFRQHHSDNIPALEKLYGARFSHIYHLVPVVRGFAPVAGEIAGNVIPLHGDPRRYGEFIAQGSRHYFRAEYTHYFFIHCDFVLCAGINQDNFLDSLNLDEEGAAFLSDLYRLHQRPDWVHTAQAFAFRAPGSPFPAYEEALQKFAAHGLATAPVGLTPLLLRRGYAAPRADSMPQKITSALRWLKMVLRRLRHVLTWPAGERKLAYPLVGGDTGLVVVPASGVREFCRYCEAFAELDLSVAIALPSALALSCKKIVTHKDVGEAGN